MALARAKKAARTSAAWKAKVDGLGRIDADALHVTVTFFPPDRRHRDLDNMLSASKALLDGVSDVVGIDDSKWTLNVSKAATIERDGMVKIVLHWVEKGAKAA